ncbi:hypothetical protein EC991_000752 [Linnemannia zychae]|nr:hypothetical protein EC991_000752 [Linnemannia zychae]
MIHKATFTDLPYEVQEQIEPYLNQQDLSVCVRVCQAWRVLYNPYLWTHVDIIWDEAAATRSTPYALKTNAHLIHSLKLDCDFDQFPHFLNICPDSYFPHLTSAQIYATCDEDDWAIVKFIRRGSPTGWKRLDLSWRYSIYRKVHFGAHLFDAIIRNAARTLEVLRFEGDSYIGSKEINRLLCSAPKLKELSFTNKKMKRSGGLLDAREIVRSEWICSDLEIFACRIGKIPRPDIMRNIFGRANDSFIHRGSPKENVHIAAFIDLSSAGWKRLLFRTTPGSEFKTPFHFSTLSVEALCKHTSTLEVFHVEAKTFIPGRGINHLLCSAPLLKELNLMANHKEPYGSWMDVDMIADSEWVCKDLEVFACEIGNIRRLDITRDIGDELMEDYISQPGKHQKSIEVQRKIYSKLAKFTKLRVLNLGVVIDTTDSDYQLGDKEVFRRYDSLAMTIESGLDLLKGLKELRVVDLSNMEVYIDGEPEQSWFKEHWPLANVITTGYLDE